MQNETRYVPQHALPSVEALAFLGDAAFSLCVRRHLILSGGGRAGELNALSLRYVTAERQATFYDRLSPLFTEEERDLARRAQNHKHLSRPKSATMQSYRKATALEAVFGMHAHLGNETRIHELFSLAVGDETEKNKVEIEETT